MRVFLTGGTGFIGQPLTLRLRARGWDVTALVRNPDSIQAKKIAAIGATLIKGDVTDKESMRAGMSGAHMVVHNAAWYELGISGKDIQKMDDINVGGTEKVLELAQELGIPRVEYVSSLVAMGDSGEQERDETCAPLEIGKTAYHRSKTKAHLVALDFQKHGLPLVIVCPGQVIGPNDHSIWGYFTRLYVNHIMPPMGWGKNYIEAHSLVDDVAEGIALAAEKGKVGEVYFLSSESIRMGEVLNLWETTPGGFKVVLYLPTGLAYVMMATMEPLQRLLRIPAFMSRESVVASTINYNFSGQKARRELGWNPRPAHELWLETLAAERELKDKRKKRDLVSLLKPLDE